MAKLRKKKLSIRKKADNRKFSSQKSGKLNFRWEKSSEYEMTEKLNDIKEMIDAHIDDIHSSVTENAKETIKFMQIIQKTNPQLFTPPSKTKPIKLDPSLKNLNRLWNQVAENHDSNDFSVAFRYPERSPKAASSINKGSKSQKNTRLTAGELFDQFDRALTVDKKLARFRRQNRGSSKRPNKVVNSNTVY